MRPEDNPKSSVYSAKFIESWSPIFLLLGLFIILVSVMLSVERTEYRINPDETCKQDYYKSCEEVYRSHGYHKTVCKCKLKK